MEPEEGVDAVEPELEEGGDCVEPEEGVIPWSRRVATTQRWWEMLWWRGDVCWW